MMSGEVFSSVHKNVQECLEILLVTYNRVEYLRKTLSQLFCEMSPIRDCYITVLDNASTDGTSDLISEYCARFPRLKHITHRINIGGNANIVEAMRLVSREYFWILCDDDDYDWSHFDEVLEEIDKGTDVIVVSRNLLTSNTPLSIIVNELFFLPAGIYKSNLINNEVILNAYSNIYNSFPQAALYCYAINNKKKIGIVKNNIVIQNVNKDVPFFVKRFFGDQLEYRVKYAHVFLAFVFTFQLLSDKKFRYKCCETLWLGRSFWFSLVFFIKNNSFCDIMQLFSLLSFRQKGKLLTTLIFYHFFYIFYRYVKNWI